MAQDITKLPTPNSNDSNLRKFPFSLPSCSSGESNVFSNDARQDGNSENTSNTSALKNESSYEVSVIVPNPTLAESNLKTWELVSLHFHVRNSTLEFSHEYSGDKTVLFIKQHVGEFIAIAVAQQEWSGWPAGTTDCMAIGEVFPETGFSKEVPKLVVGETSEAFFLLASEVAAREVRSSVMIGSVFPETGFSKEVPKLVVWETSEAFFLLASEVAGREVRSSVMNVFLLCFFWKKWEYNSSKFMSRFSS